MAAQSVLETLGDWVWKPVYSRFAAKVRMPARMTDDTGGGTDQEEKASETNVDIYGTILRNTGNYPLLRLGLHRPTFLVRCYVHTA